MLESDQRPMTQRSNFYEIFNTSNTTNDTKGNTEEKDIQSIRISSVNHCGITTTNFHHVLTQARKMKIDIQCFVENNLNMKDYFVRRNILNTLKRFDSQAISRKWEDGATSC